MLVWLAFAGQLRHWKLTMTLDRARMVASDPAVFAAPLAARPPHPGTRLARWLPGPRERFALASALLDQAAHARGIDAARTRGTAYALAGDPAHAAEAFSSIPPGERDASDWNDLAAVQWAAASGPQSHDRLLLALDATGRALRLRPGMPEALFNRALAADALDLEVIAQKNWRHFLKAGPHPPWSAIARQRLAKHATTDVESWRLGTMNLDQLAPQGLEELTRRLPELSRRHGEGPFLSSWAETLAGDPAAAARHLQRARLIGKTLRAQSGESFLIGAVEAVDRSASHGQSPALAEAHLLYRSGREALFAGLLDAAARNLIAARNRFRAEGSPMAQLAGLHLSNVLIEQNRIPEALERLQQLTAAERKAGSPHKALLANILWNMALCEAVRGHWSDSLVAAQEATAIYRALGENGNAAGTMTILSEDYDLLGQPSMAWHYGREALRRASAHGDLSRVRVTLAVLCRTELRGKRWPLAAALVDLEHEVAAFPIARRDARLDADMHLRSAIVAIHLGEPSGARSAVGRARATVRTMPDESAREKLAADIDGAAGAMFRPEDPRQAIALLTSAIAFQKKAERPIVLPELLLERGRAYQCIRRPDAAEQDFREGIRELERQRAHITDSEIRPGIFDDAADLFDELVSLQLDRGASPAEVLAVVERGRARAMLEEMEAEEHLGLVPVTSLEDVQRNLRSGSTLIEYFLLPRRAIVFVASGKDLLVRIVPVSRTTLAAQANQFTNSLASRRPAAEIRSQAAALYDVLIAPVRDSLESAEVIVFVPDTTLQRVPFAALFDRRANAFLVERHTISTQPSAGVFASTAIRFSTPKQDAALPAAVFGNPEIPRDLYPNLSSLPGAEREARVVGRDYPRGRVFLGRDATAEQFLRTAPLSALVHFSGHAELNASEPGRSALILSSTSAVPGPLTQRAIARMHFRSTRLVVLAACSTMRGREATIEGVPTIARAFLIAGAPAVIGTLWDIEDGDAVPLMEALHEQIALGRTPADALRQAQLGALRSESPARRHPTHWSAFALNGM